MCLSYARVIWQGPVYQATPGGGGGGGGGGLKSPEPAPLSRPTGPQVHCGDTKRTFASALDRLRSHNNDVPVFSSGGRKDTTMGTTRRRGTRNMVAKKMKTKTTLMRTSLV